MKHYYSMLIKIMVFSAIILFSKSVASATVKVSDINANEPIVPVTYQQILGKGMDVDWSKTSQGRKYYSEKVVKEFKKENISHVRIRIKDDISENLFDNLDKQIKDWLKNGMIPVIAYQANAFKNSVTDEDMELVINWWSKMAEHCKDYSYLLSFDLMIECSDALNKAPDKLNELYEKLVAQIRKTNPNRIIMISPRVRSDAQYLKELDIPTNANGYLMAEWHFYASGPSKTNERKKWTTGTSKEKALITEKINLALKWQKETGIPTWVGAWMAGDYNEGNTYTITEQVEFAHYMVTQLEKSKIPFAVNSDTKFYSREKNTWISSMIPLRKCIYSSYSSAVNDLLKNTSILFANKSAVKKNKSLHINWKKARYAQKYQIVVATTKNMKVGKKVYNVKKNSLQLKNIHKKKKIYVKIRAVRTYKNKKIYSKYSRQKVFSL